MTRVEPELVVGPELVVEPELVADMTYKVCV